MNTPYMKDRFIIFEKQVKERDGESYSLDNYKENYDYIRRAVRYGTRVIFRDTILENTASPEPVEKQAEKPVELTAVEKQLAKLKKCRVTRKYPNPRIVETDKGRVFVGGHNVKLGQIILVKNNTLVLGRA